jgi:hypothetical protein
VPRALRLFKLRIKVNVEGGGFRKNPPYLLIPECHEAVLTHRN